MSDEERKAQEVAVAKVMGDYYYCPNTNEIILGMPHDDKALCTCGRSNKNLTFDEGQGVHIVRFLKKATAEEWVEQHERQKKEWKQGKGTKY